MGNGSRGGVRRLVCHLYSKEVTGRRAAWGREREPERPRDRQRDTPRSIVEHGQGAGVDEQRAAGRGPGRGLRRLSGDAARGRDGEDQSENEAKRGGRRPDTARDQGSRLGSSADGSHGTHCDEEGLVKASPSSSNTCGR